MLRVIVFPFKGDVMFCRLYTGQNKHKGNPLNLEITDAWYYFFYSRVITEELGIPCIIVRRIINFTHPLCFVILLFLLCILLGDPTQSLNVRKVTR